MKYTSPLLIAAFCAAPFLTAAPAQAEDILSILARQDETPPRLAPSTIPYSYTLSIDMQMKEGKKTADVQAVLRIDPSKPAGQRAEIVSVSDPENEDFLEFLKEIEDPEKQMAESAEGFWCGSIAETPETEAQIDFDPAAFTVVSEDETQAVIKPDLSKLAELLMQSEESEDMDKTERKMMKKLMERIDGEVTLAKPTAEMTRFQVTMTRPMTMMVVAKLKVMDVEQNCALAPNGFYHLSTMNMNVEGKALGKKFGQKVDIRVSDLRPTP